MLDLIERNVEIMARPRLQVDDGPTKDTVKSISQQLQRLVLNELGTLNDPVIVD